MAYKFISLIILFNAIYFLKIVRSDGCFRASVFEHVRQGNINNQSEAIDFNLKVYEHVIKIAASQVIN